MHNKHGSRHGERCSYFTCLCLTCVSCSERVLGVVHSKGLHDPGPVRWPLALCLLAAWIVIFLCMLKGIRSSGKVNQHNVVIVRSHKTHTVLPFVAKSCRPNVRLCCLVSSGGLCNGYLPVLCAHCFDHQRCYTGGLSSGRCFLPHTRLEPIS